nr:MAG TPA: hypothetical protein [Caudoviricetes sp.]
MQDAFCNLCGFYWLSLGGKLKIPQPSSLFLSALYHISTFEANSGEHL